jgi:hypothetical protein
MPSRQILRAVLIFLCAPAAFLHAAVDTDLANQINNSDYNLKRSGLIEFRCTVSPNWKLAYQNLNTDAVGDELLRLLEHTHFAVAVGPDGSSTISRQTDAIPSSEQVAARLRTVVTGFEGVLTGFFQVWSGYTFHPIVSVASGTYKIEHSTDEYRVIEKSAQESTSSLFNNELLLTEMVATALGKSVTLHLNFVRRSGLYVFSGYDAVYPVGASSVHTIATVDYQEAQGFDLPSTVRVMANQVVIPFDFGNYEIKKRD